MYSKKFSERSPLRVLEKSIHGGLGQGNLGIVVSRAGTGKTACLVQVAIDSLIRDRNVLHVSLHDSVDHVRTWYDEMLDEFARAIGEAEFPRADRALLERSRYIHTYRDHSFSVEKLRQAVAFLEMHAHFTPDTIIVDGYDFASASEEEVASLATLAAELKAEIWASALSHRHEPVDSPRGIPNPVARFESSAAVIMALEPSDGAISIRILKDHDNPDVSGLTLLLDKRSFLIHQG